LEHQVASMKRWLFGIVREHGYETVQEFMQEYQAARKEYKAYMAAVEEWRKQTEAKSFMDMQMREAKKRTEAKEEYRGYHRGSRVVR
jgi:N-methylhydantoinase B/oxoprolinase/acetone carboxylase alpha subunit